MNNLANDEDVLLIEENYLAFDCNGGKIENPKIYYNSAFDYQLHEYFNALNYCSDVDYIVFKDIKTANFIINWIETITTNKKFKREENCLSYKLDDDKTTFVPLSDVTFRLNNEIKTIEKVLNRSNAYFDRKGLN